MDAQGFFLVYAAPGPLVAEQEFNDWYENEHIPLRVGVSSFLSWTRWVAADGAQPKWCATYDLHSADAIEQPEYAALAGTRSEREKDILSRLGWMDRRTYEACTGPAHVPSPNYDGKKAGALIVFNSVDVAPEGEEEFNRWYDEEHIPMLAKVPGWVRSRRFVLKSWQRGGKDGAKDQTKPPKLLAVHEWESDAGFQSNEYKQCMNTEWRTKVTEYVTDRERRVFKFWKSWERE